MRVEEHGRTFGFWPDAMQELLLRAALLEKDGAREAFDEWASRVDIARLDGASVRLLPLLYHNLLEHGIQAPGEIQGLIRGTYRQTWFKNQLLIGYLGPLLERFENAGISTLVLKGVPLALRYYPKPATRPMADVDVLVRRDRAADALDLARSAGLIPKFQADEWPPCWTASGSFGHPDGWDLDLHTHTIHERLESDADEEAWRSAVAIDVAGVHTLTLSAEDHLLHVIAHGVRRNGLPPVRWVADATMVIRTQGAALDWLRLWSEARARRLTRLVREALRYLNDRMAIAVPREVLQRFDDTPVGLTERCEYRAQLMTGIAGFSTTRVLDYLSARERSRQYRGPLGMVRFLRDVWRLDSSWQVPGALGRKTFRKLRA